MSEPKCQDCNGELNYWDEGYCSETELWSCDSCNTVVTVPISIERHFDDVDWSCVDDK